jgi:hypothetical protein
MECEDLVEDRGMTLGLRHPGESTPFRGFLPEGRKIGMVDIYCNRLAKLKLICPILTE